jgi:hypothetical protein
MEGYLFKKERERERERERSKWRVTCLEAFGFHINIENTNNKAE